MQPIRPTRSNSYTGSPLDRASDKRNDAAWIAEALHDPRGRWLAVWRSWTLVHGTTPVFLPRAAAAASIEAGAAWAWLGTHQSVPYFAFDAGRDEPAPFADAGRFADLRQLGPGLAASDAAVLAHARAMIHWRARHQFCGVCGTLCAPRQGGTVLGCPGCGTSHFPRTDPAVIMLVCRGDRVLLGHAARFARTSLYSTLAGFVEPGESLEEAVRREVYEETAIAVGAVQYHSSQPWPFPGSIMLGFQAEGLSDAVSVDGKELRHARWFHRDEIADPGAHGFTLPPADSIARRLIDDWLLAS